MEPGATTLAYVFRKLVHTFYDAPDERLDYIVDKNARTQDAVYKAGVTIFRIFGLGRSTA